MELSIALSVFRECLQDRCTRSRTGLFIALLLTSTARSVAADTNSNPITREDVAGAEALIGLEFSDEKEDMMLPGLKEQLDNYLAIRKFPLSNSVPPAMMFNPIPVGMKLERGRDTFKTRFPKDVKLPAKTDDLAFYSVAELGALIRTRQISSEKLTRFFLDRLKKYGPKLECVVTLTEEVGLEQAKRADAELARGHSRGPLHGIPYGAKDLLAT